MLFQHFVVVPNIHNRVLLYVLENIVGQSGSLLKFTFLEVNFLDLPLNLRNLFL